MSIIIESLKSRIMEEFSNSKGKQVTSFYRFKQGQNFVEILGNDDEYIQIRVHNEGLSQQELRDCVVEDNNRSLRARYWVKDLASVEDAIEKIRKSHSYIQKISRKRKYA